MAHRKRIRVFRKMADGRFRQRVGERCRELPSEAANGRACDYRSLKLLLKRGELLAQVCQFDPKLTNVCLELLDAVYCWNPRYGCRRRWIRLDGNRAG